MSVIDKKNKLELSFEKVHTNLKYLYQNLEERLGLCNRKIVKVLLSEIFPFKLNLFNHIDA